MTQRVITYLQVGMNMKDFAKRSRDLMLLSGPASGHWKLFSRSSHAPPSPGPCTGRPVLTICCHRRQRQFHHHQLLGSSPGHPACPRPAGAPFRHRESDTDALHRPESVRAPHSSVLRTAAPDGHGCDRSTDCGRQRVHPARAKRTDFICGSCLAIFPRILNQAEPLLSAARASRSTGSIAVSPFHLVIPFAPLLKETS